MSTTSTLSEAKKLLKGSERESKINYKAIVFLLVGGGLLWFAGTFIWSGQRVPSWVDRPMPEPTLPLELPTQAVFALPTEEAATPTPTAWPTAIIVERSVPMPVEVTREVVIFVPGPEIEVTRIVEVAAIPFPTITPVPLASGTIKVCASVEGATGLYIGNEGVVSGACKTYSFGVGQTTILVQVNR